MPLFEVSTFASQILWMLGVFLALYIVVLFLIIPAFRSIFDVRSQYIAKKLKESEALIACSEKLKQDYEERLLAIKQYNADQIDSATQEMKKIAAAAIDKLDHECNIEFLSYEKELLDFYKSAANDLNKITLNTAEDIISKLTNEPVNRKKLEKYNN